MPTSPGTGSVVAARMAVEDFGAAAKGLKVEIVGADHQNKPDVGSNIVRTWIDVDKVDVIVDVPTSVGRARGQRDRPREEQGVPGLRRGRLRPHRPKCSPNTIHWTYDTWALANGTGKAMVKTGGDSWFFLTADYAFGHALERDTAAVVEKPTAARCSARCAIRSRAPTSRRSCCRRRPRRPRSSGSPMPAATPSTRSSRRPSSASSRAGRSSPGCWCSSPTCTRSACRPRRA